MSVKQGTCSDMASDVKMDDDGRDYVQSLERGFAVLQSFGADKAQMTLAEVAKRTGLSRGTARRFLLTLTKLGHLATDGRLFWLRPKVLSLGSSFLSSLPWWRVAQPIVEEASRSTGQACNISVLDGTMITFVICIANDQTVFPDLSLGSRLPAYATASGRVLLATLSEAELSDYFATVELKPLTSQTIIDQKQLRAILDDVREQGYCFSNEELRDGLRAIAVPLIDRSGKVLAAISIYASEPEPQLRSEFLLSLRRSQAAIQRAL